MRDWIGWQFLQDDGRLRYGDGCKPQVGEVLTADGPPVLCRSGMHASRRAIDALDHARGSLACRVRLGGKIVEGNGKAVAETREITAMADATDALHEFAVDCAMSALELAGIVDERCWKALHIKLLWLDGQATGAELRAAWGAAMEAARGAAWQAAWQAAWGAAWEAAWRAALAAAWGAAWQASRDVARGAAREASRDVAWKMAWDKQNARLESILTSLLGVSS